LLDPGNDYGTAKDATRRTILTANLDVDLTATAPSSALATTVRVKDVTNIILDGFVITGGTNSGLGIKNVSAPAITTPETVQFQNLEITRNKKFSQILPGQSAIDESEEGTGLFIFGGAPRLKYLTVTESSTNYLPNLGSGYGAFGGICITEGSAAVITNAFISENKTNLYGGGMGVYDSTPRLENIIVINNEAQTGSGMYLHGNPVIVNAVVSGNTVDNARDSVDVGGAIYVAGGSPLIVNALVSGNRVKVSNANNGGSVVGGGIGAVDGSKVTLINSTVSGNYLVDRDEKGIKGAGIRAENPLSISLYNSLVLGNTGVAGKENDATTNGAFIAYNSLVGGWTKADMDATGGDSIGVSNNNNEDGMDYARDTWGGVNNKLQTFFFAFPALPNKDNTGSAYNFSAWDFRLNARLGAAAAIGSGNKKYLDPLTAGFTEAELPYEITKDLDDNVRTQMGAPDLGAYETIYQGLGVIGGTN
jgi:hypothetical protein